MVGVTAGIVRLLPPRELEGVIAHELAHTLQQPSLTPAGGALPASQPGDAHEREAHAAAEPSDDPALRGTAERLYAQIVIGANNPSLPNTAWT